MSPGREAESAHVAAEGHDVSIQALSHHKKGERESNALMQASANS